MSRIFCLRCTLGLVVVVAAAGALGQAGCGQTGPDSAFGDGTGGAGDDAASAQPPGLGGGGNVVGPGDADPDARGALVVTPSSATVNVTVVDGVVTANAPVTFSASYDGQTVAAQWLLDRGELGDVDGSGVFHARGTSVGTGVVTARYGAREGTATIKVVASASQNGAPAGVDAGAGSGGLGGVGGEPLGGAVDAAIVMRLKSESQAPASATELGFLYPYDKTVWPRGLLPPLVMWQTTHEGSAVYVKLSQGNYAFEGTYSLAQLPAGSDARKRVRLEDVPWKIATGGNQGDDLKLEVKIYSAGEDKVFGPITESWKVAPGVLKGTVYYNSYDSALTGGSNGTNGGIIAIKPRSPDPVLAVPANAGKCNVCHVVSADGSTLWAQDANYKDGASYDLTKSSPPRTPYLTSTSTQNDHKFVWAAPYPDGSFALASSRFAREAFLQTDAKLFARAGGSEVPSTGLAGVVKSAVTPAFSPDGRKVAFNFWQGAGVAGGAQAGNGRSLAIFDFTCGAAPGSTTCAQGAPRAFANLREIYKDSNRYPAWPSFLPDGKAVVFHDTINGGSCGPNPLDPTSNQNCQLTTWNGARAEIWIARDATAQDARMLDALNGLGFAPTSGLHPDDTKVNYQPTVNPVPSGGYFWVVFTSRRLYGNLLTGDSWSYAPIKKLWVAAIDISPGAGADPSHPAFYLPGQELEAGNTRGFWAVDPCKANGQSCESGDECCNGFCRNDPAGGGLTCMDKPPAQCAQEFEKCTIDADCCDPSQRCINGKCSLPAPPVVK